MTFPTKFDKVIEHVEQMTFPTKFEKVIEHVEQMTFPTKFEKAMFGVIVVRHNLGRGLCLH